LLGLKLGFGRIFTAPLKLRPNGAIQICLLLSSLLLDSLYGTFWRCSRVRLWLRRKWPDLDEILKPSNYIVVDWLWHILPARDPRSSDSWRARQFL